MHTSTPITIAIARFDDLLAHGLKWVIERDASLEIVADDIEHHRLGVVLRARRPRVAVLDVNALTNLAEVRALEGQHPETRLVLLVSQPTTAECAQALAFGASAYLGKNTQARDVLSAVHLASRGLQLIPRETRDAARRPSPGSQLLTQREAEVLPMLQQGSSNAEIAAALCVSVETVRTHAGNIYRKLGVSSRRELATLPPPPPVQPADSGALRAHRSSPGGERPGPAPPPRHHVTRSRQRHGGSARR